MASASRSDGSRWKFGAPADFTRSWPSATSTSRSRHPRRSPSERERRCQVPGFRGRRRFVRPGRRFRRDGTRGTTCT
jgi:hypothetical protein